MSQLGCRKCTEERGQAIALVERKKLQDPQDGALVTILACPFCGNEAAIKQRRMLYQCKSCGHEEHEIVKGGTPEDPKALLARMRGLGMDYSQNFDQTAAKQQSLALINALRTTQADERF